MSTENFLENYKLEGEKLEILTYPNPILLKKAEKVTEFNDELRTLCKNMLFTMYKAPGVGLAAPQVGKSIRLFVIDVDYEREKVTRADGTEDYNLSDFHPLVVINPIIKEKDGEQIYEEGCLSVPGVYEEVKRAQHVVLEYQDAYGKTQILDAEDLRAVCVQHENDHLDGIVFLERLSLLKKKFAKKKYLRDQGKE